MTDRAPRNKGPPVTNNSRGRPNQAPINDGAQTAPAAPNHEQPKREPRKKPEAAQPAPPAEEKQVDPAYPHPHHQPPHPTPDFLSNERFRDIPNLLPETARALQENFKYEIMTKVQAAAIPPGLAGRDILGKARTGTGKTLAFLIPCVDRISLHRASAAAKRAPLDNDTIGALILSPTRELALQIFEESHLLTRFHRLRNVVVYGGTNIRTDQRNLAAGADILVATPGRLIDHLENTQGFANRIQRLQVLVLDEADQMLEMGFRPSILKILSFLPKQGRQTMLFSATVSKELVQMAPQILGSGQFEFIDAIGSGSSAAKKEDTTQSGGAVSSGAKLTSVAALQADNPFSTAAQVKQDYVIVEDTSAQFAAVYYLLERERKSCAGSHKIIVFFTTARQTQLFAELFNAMGYPTLEIHSRQSQGARTRASDTFHDQSGVTMFSSDVTARGMDYPDVTFVLQVGIPASAEQYVHRLGRTARAGKEGHGTLLLFRQEALFLKSLSQLHLSDATASLPSQPESDVAATIARGLASLPEATKSMAYAAWLGFYNSSKVPWNKEELVRQANVFATKGMGLASPPEIPKKTIGKMGLKGVPGLVVESDPHQQRGGNNNNLGGKRGRCDGGGNLVDERRGFSNIKPPSSFHQQQSRSQPLNQHHAEHRSEKEREVQRIPQPRTAAAVPARQEASGRAESGRQQQPSARGRGRGVPTRSSYIDPHAETRY